jgi:divinyl chlorophyllide a 8-vinyl-reductase
LHSITSSYINGRCNPIAESDLASFILDCIDDNTKWNKILNVGGPDEGITMKEQGELIFQVLP